MPAEACTSTTRTEASPGGSIPARASTTAFSKLVGSSFFQPCRFTLEAGFDLLSCRPHLHPSCGPYPELFSYLFRFYSSRLKDFFQKVGVGLLLKFLSQLSQNLPKVCVTFLPVSYNWGVGVALQAPKCIAHFILSRPLQLVRCYWRSLFQGAHKRLRLSRNHQIFKILRSYFSPQYLKQSVHFTRTCTFLKGSVVIARITNVTQGSQRGISR